MEFIKWRLGTHGALVGRVMSSRGLGVHRVMVHLEVLGALVGGRELRLEAEVADDPDEKTIGLMGRKELAEGQGMLFVFSRPQPMGFWMKDTLIPLSIAYLNAEGFIREIHDMQPLEENAIPSVFGDLVYALEVPQGWFAKNGIMAGDKVIGLPKPSDSD